MLGYYALQVVFAGRLKQPLAFGLDVVHVKQEERMLRNDFSQGTFAFNQGCLAHVLAVEVQNVKGAEAVCTSSKKQFVKLRAAALIQADNLPIQNGLPRFERKLDTSARSAKLLNRLPFREIRRTPEGSA